VDLSRDTRFIYCRIGIYLSDFTSFLLRMIGADTVLQFASANRAEMMTALGWHLRKYRVSHVMCWHVCLILWVDDLTLTVDLTILNFTRGFLVFVCMRLIVECRVMIPVWVLFDCKSCCHCCAVVSYEIGWLVAQSNSVFGDKNAEAWDPVVNYALPVRFL